MRKLTISTVQATLVFALIGCGGGDAPSEYVGGKDANDVKTDSVVPPQAVDTDLPATIDLQEPTPVEEPGTAENLILGDAAPPISISKWVNGNPVEAFSADKVYVVEFWATWCGPCLASMPHIASLQTEYGDDVTFIGVSAEEEDVVTEFMGQDSRSGKTWSEVLTYTIALDESRKTSAAYMQAAGQNGIPCAFIVGKSGKVEWIGHPIEIDQPLQQVVDGTWDLEKARNAFVATREAQAVMEEYRPKINAALQKGDYKSGAALIEQLIERFPENGEFKRARLTFLLKGEIFEEANRTAEILIKESNDNAPELNQLAWILATGVSGPGPDLNLALSAAKRAEELTESKDASVLDTLSRVLFLKGNIEEAISIQKKAIEIADPRSKLQFEEALNEYEDALKSRNTEAKSSDAVEEKPAENDEVKPADPPAADAGT